MTSKTLAQFNIFLPGLCVSQQFVFIYFFKPNFDNYKYMFDNYKYMFTTKKVISKYLPLEETIKTHFIAAKVVIKWAKNSTNLNEYLPVVNFWLDHLARSVSISNDHYHMLTYSCNNIKLAKRTIFYYSYRIFI